MRNSPSRTRDALKNGRGKKSIVVCVPAIDARIGLPFLGPSSMSASATRRAVDVLRREVRVAASTGGAEGMNDIEVVSLEVGALDIPPFAGRRMLDYDPKEYTKSWTPSEKLAYEPAWELTLEGSSRKYERKAQKVDLFVGDLVQIVSYGRVCSVSFCGLRLHVGSIFGWLRGGRYAVGSGGNVDMSKLGDLMFADMLSLPLPSRSLGELDCVAPTWCSTRHHHQHPVLPPFRSQGLNSESRICVCFCIVTYIFTCYAAGATTSTGPGSCSSITSFTATSFAYTSRSTRTRDRGRG